MMKYSVSVMTIVAMASVAQASDGWYSTYHEAEAVAKEQNLPLLIHFHASFCGPCRQMSAQVFSQRNVQQQLRKGLAAVEVDIQHDPALAQRYGATTVPRDVVVFPDGRHETINIGFKSTYVYIDLLKDIARRGEQFAVPQQSLVADNETSDSASAADKASTPDRSEIVGLEGFCPVQLIRDRKWVTGNKELKDQYRGVTYYFSSREDLDYFRDNPSKFTPQNLGCDPVVLYDNQQAVSGDIRFGAFFDNKLFLFDSQKNRAEFKENPLKFSVIRHAVKLDELSGRRFQ